LDQAKEISLFFENQDSKNQKTLAVFNQGPRAAEKYINAWDLKKYPLK
jgi:hypothetical protein